MTPHMSASIAAVDRFVPLGIALLLVTACSVGPAYHKPDSALTSSIAGEDLLNQRQGDAPAPSLDRWWLGFQDQVLTGIVQRALDENLSLAVAMARVDQARAVAAAAGAVRLPKVDLDGRVLHQRQSLKSPEGQLASAFPGYERNQTIEAIGVGASWEADLAGGLAHGQQAAVEELHAAEAAGTGVRISVAAEAADAYFRIRGAQQRIVVAEEQIHTQGALVGLVQDRFAAGLASKREIAQAQALLLQARTTVPPFRTELAQQINRLDVLLGMQPGTFAGRLMSEHQEYTIPTIAADLGPSELLRRRPDVIAAERRLAASNARIGMAVSEYYPRVSLGGVLGFESLHGALITSAAFQPQGLFGLHWRLFDFGRVDAEVQRAKGAYAEALAEYRQTMLRAAEDVASAITTLIQLELQRVDLVQEINAHRTARDAAEDAYQGGAVSLIEVLDEDLKLLRARDQLAQLDATNARAAIATFRVLGGGWHAESQQADTRTGLDPGKK